MEAGRQSPHDECHESNEEISSLVGRASTYEDEEHLKLTSTDGYWALRRDLLGVYLLALVVLFLLWLNAGHHDNQESQPAAHSQVRITEQRLPRIFWIYTENEREAEPMESDIYVQYYASKAQQFHYEVRYANSWNAYDWLTNGTIEAISRTMQNSLIDETVHSILKLALLMENGGVMADWGTLFRSTDLAWLQEMFDVYEGKPLLQYGCNSKDSFVYMPAKGDPVFSMKYRSSLIAAAANSSLLKEAFILLTDVIKTGKVPYNSKLNLLAWNEDTRVSYLPQSLETVLNLAVYKLHKQSGEAALDPCTLGLQHPLQPLELYFEPQEEVHLLRTVTSQWGFQAFLQFRGIERQESVLLVTGVNRPSVDLYLSWMMTGTVTPAQLHNHSLLFQVLAAPGNREVFLQPLPERQVQLCLVVMENMNQKQLIAASTAFDNQTFEDWKLVLPAQDKAGLQLASSQRVVIMQGQSNKVHNIERGVARHCQPKAFAVLLNKDENFNSPTALAEITKAAKPRGTVGLYVSLSKDGRVTSPKRRWTIFDREFNGIIAPRVSRMRQFLNHFRVLAVETFRQLPQFSMRDMYGKYFQDRCIFLMDLLDQPKDVITEPRQLYLIKKFALLWIMPLRIDLAPPSASIRIKQWEEVSLEQLEKTRTRLPSVSVEEQLRSILEWKIPLTKLVAPNPGSEFTPIQERKGPEVIPRIIHQIWLGTSELPPAKQYCYEKAKKLYPNYDIKLWREHNITRQRFPMTYDVITTIIDFNKHSPYNKLASVTDIMRHEILYREGGFWKDAGMNFLRPVLDQFLKYKLVLPVDRLFKYRYLQGMCFFGNAPRYPNLMRINSYRNLNRMRIYQTNALNIAGPVDFRQLLVGQEEYDPDILLLPYETFYPGQVGQHPQNDLCTKRKKNLRRGQKWQIVENGWYLLSDCPSLYPYAFAIEHNHFGSTWQKRHP